MYKRSLKKYIKSKSKKISKVMSRQRSMKFGNSILSKFKSKDEVFNLLSKIVSPIKIIKILLYIKDFSKNTLNELKPEETVLTLKEKIENYFIKLYKPRFDDFIEKMKPSQLILLLDQKYTSEIKNKLLFNRDPNIDSSKMNSLEKLESVLLNSIFGKTLLLNIKNFIKSLTTQQITLLINEKFNISNALYNSFLNTKYPTNKTVKQNLPSIKNELSV